MGGFFQQVNKAMHNAVDIAKGEEYLLPHSR
jgi:hypothetical protein